MKKNKGYTLAELLVIIAIIGILISLTSYTITRVINASRNNIKEQELDSLLDAGKSYINSVIDGEEKYSFPDNKNLSGYDFIENIYNRCEYYTSRSNDDGRCVREGSNGFNLYISVNSLDGYIDTDKYYAGNRCAFYAKLTISKNDKGYLVVDGIDMKTSVKAKTCVK